MRYLFILFSTLGLSSAQAHANVRVDLNYFEGSDIRAVGGYAGPFVGWKVRQEKLSIAYTRNGNAYRRKGSHGLAIVFYTKAIDINPKNARLYYNRAIAYRSKGQFANAIADYDRAIELNPEDAAAYNNRAWTHLKWGKAAQGYADVKMALRLEPDNSGIWDTLGEIHEALGNMPEAISAYRKAMTLDPKQEIGRSQLKRLGVLP